MCYVVYLSTSCQDDLTSHNSALVRFSHEHLDAEPAAGVLANPFRWYVGSMSGCSCGFRHVMDSQFGFDIPQDWNPEDDEDVRATQQFFEVVKTLILRGCAVDCVDAWIGAEADGIQHLDVRVDSLKPGEFRFFENYHFVFR